jgi:bacterioferritin
MKHEQAAIAIYEELLVASEGASIYIEEYAREMIKTEEIHRIELNKMLKDFAD